jgi:hypothetical protein
VDPTQAPAWLQAGGTIVFAMAVWYEQRAMRRSMELQNKLLVAIAVKAGVRLDTEPPDRDQ